MLYRILRWISRIGLRWYYRGIEVRDADRVPRTGPVVLAANHNNALVDALIVATSIDREVRLTAKATLLSHPLTRVIVRAAGVIPLRRAADEARAGIQPSEDRNRSAFDAVVDALRSDGVVLIFPEGISHSGPELAPLRTGCARMALEAHGAGVSQVQLLPVGLTFEAKERPRSRVVVQFGDPIPVATVAGAPDAVGQLTRDLDTGLRAVTLNFESRDEALETLGLSRALSVALSSTRPLGDPLPPLSDTVDLARRIERARAALPHVAPAVGQRITTFAESLERWYREARAAGVSPADVDMPLSTGAGLVFAFREILLGVLIAPLALWGRVNHWLPIAAALGIARATSSNPDEPAMHTLVGGLLLVGVWYVLIAAGLVHWFGWPWALAYLALLPPLATLGFWWSDRLRATIRRAKGYLALRRQPALAHQLRAQQQTLRDEATAIAGLLDQVPVTGGR